jgi:hypothetical protein
MAVLVLNGIALRALVTLFAKPTIEKGASPGIIKAA